MNRIVADGYQRLIEANALEARKIVEARSAAQLASAGFVRLWLLRIRISREVTHELDRMPQPSPESLY